MTTFGIFAIGVLVLFVASYASWKYLTPGYQRPALVGIGGAMLVWLAVFATYALSHHAP